MVELALTDLETNVVERAILRPHTDEIVTVSCLAGDSVETCEVCAIVEVRLSCFVDVYAKNSRYIVHIAPIDLKRRKRNVVTIGI